MRNRSQPPVHERRSPTQPSNARFATKTRISAGDSAGAAAEGWTIMVTGTEIDPLMGSLVWMFSWAVSGALELSGGMST